MKMTDVELMKISSELVENGFKVYGFCDDSILFVKHTESETECGVLKRVDEVEYSNGKFEAVSKKFLIGDNGVKVGSTEEHEFDDYCDVMEFIRR